MKSSDEAEERVRTFVMQHRRRFAHRLTRVASVVGSHGEIFVLDREDLEALLGIQPMAARAKRIRIVRSK